MSNDYLKHYGVKKSQWSPQARARYDARHRPKAISDESNTSGSFGPAQSEAYKRLTPKERERVNALAKQSKKFRKQYTSGFNIMGQGIPKFILKKIDKKSNFGALQNKYAEEVIRNRRYKTATSGQSGAAANIIKRQPGAKQVAANKNGKVYKLPKSATVSTMPNRTDASKQNTRNIIDDFKEIYDEAKKKSNNKKEYNKAIREIRKEYKEAMIDRLHNSSRKRNDSGKTTTVEKRGNGLGGKSLSGRQELAVRQAVLEYNRQKKGGLTAADKARSHAFGKIINKKIANAKTEREYHILQDIKDGHDPGTTELVSQYTDAITPQTFHRARKSNKKRPVTSVRSEGNNHSESTSTNSSLPKAGFIFKRPQAKRVGNALYDKTKKQAHKVKKQNEYKKEAQDAFERHKKEATEDNAKKKTGSKSSWRWRRFEVKRQKKK